MRRVKRLQKAPSRKLKGSRNRQEARLRFAHLHARVSDHRRDFLHKLSTQLIRENQTVALEDLNVAEMLKKHNLAEAISGVQGPTLRS